MNAAIVTMFADEAAAFELLQESRQAVPESAVCLDALAKLADAEVYSLTTRLIDRRRDEALCVELAAAAGLRHRLPRLIASYAQAYADAAVVSAERARRESVAA